MLLPTQGFSPTHHATKSFQWNHFDYLKEIRLQWFEVLDQLAYIQHSVIPRREKTYHKLTDEYTEVAGVDARSIHAGETLIDYPNVFCQALDCSARFQSKFHQACTD